MEASNDPTDTAQHIRGAIECLGGFSAVARRADITHMAVARWIDRGLPAERVLWLAEQTDWRYTPHQLAPSLYPNPSDGVPPMVWRWRSAAIAVPR